MTGVFPCVLKTAKVVPVFKKDSKLEYSNYLPIFLSSKIKKILEILAPFSVTITLSITYSLDSDNNVLYLMP